MAVIPVLLAASVTSNIPSSLQDAWSRAVAFLVRMTPLNIAHFFQDEVLLSSYFAYGSHAIPLTFALALYDFFRLYRMQGRQVRLVLSWSAVASTGLRSGEGMKKWRLLYMMPLEILASTGLVHALISLGLLEDSSIVNIGKKDRATRNRSD